MNANQKLALSRHGNAIGCYGDGTYGHQHTRDRCADVLAYYAHANFKARGYGIPLLDYQLDWSSLLEALWAPMSDDAWEEHKAGDWLNEHAPFTDAWWGWQDGDFGLWLEEEEDA